MDYCSPSEAAGWEPSGDDEDLAYSLYIVVVKDGEERDPPYKVCLTLNGAPVRFEVDPGCRFTILDLKNK